MSAQISATYWESRYSAKGTSGAGSTGRLARFKAGVVNRFILDNAIESVVDLGCGDGSQLALLDLPADYLGVDVSPTALAQCTRQFPERCFVSPDEARTMPPADLAMALDVVFHLVEDAVFLATMRSLFAMATRFVLIYSSNFDAPWAGSHVRHRKFTDHVHATEPDWRLIAHLPNPYAFEPSRPDDTSFADYFVYGKAGEACTLYAPPVD